jgi:signal transduction histidine kinase
LTVAAVAIVLRRALSPLSHSAIEVEQLTKGSIARLSTTGYREVDPLVKAVNELMASTRNIVEQSRLGSANLAHALRTPLSALRTRLALMGQPDAGILEDVARIEGQIDYHLRRVRRVVGAPIASTRIPVRGVADDVSLVVRKSHSDRRVEIVVDVPEDVMFRGEREDLEELLCILVDNAMKWATTRVELNARQHENKLVIMVGDDGPGIAEDRRAFVLQPGSRLDESTPGTGLGLFIAREIVAVYAGRIEFSHAVSGGLLVSVEFQSPDGVVV